MSRHQNFTFSEFLELMVLLFLGGRLLTMILHCRCEEEEQICGKKGRREEEERKRMQRLSFRKSKERGKERMKGSGVSFFFQQMGIAKVSLRVSLFGGPKKLHNSSPEGVDLHWLMLHVMHHRENTTALSQHITTHQINSIYQCKRAKDPFIAVGTQASRSHVFSSQHAVAGEGLCDPYARLGKPGPR
jgi:hypothetical protein